MVIRKYVSEYKKVKILILEKLDELEGMITDLLGNYADNDTKKGEIELIDENFIELDDLFKQGYKLCNFLNEYYKERNKSGVEGLDDLEKMKDDEFKLYLKFKNS